MDFILNTKKALLTNLGVLFMFLTIQGQLPTFSVDEDFDTNNLFRDDSGVFDIYQVDEGRLLLGGGFDNGFFSSPYRSLGMIWENGSADLSWAGTDAPPVMAIIKQNDGYVFPVIQSFFKMNLEGEAWYTLYGDWWSDYNTGGNTNPYNVESNWTIYQQEDGKLLLGGAIATDTMQSSLFRNLARIHADGSHDDTFPAIECEPNTTHSRITEIYQASNGYWYVSGSFESINGHETHHIARLTPEFEIDTDFVSPFMFEGVLSYYPRIRGFDSQNRLWISGQETHLIDAPSDTIQLIRLLNDGSVDTDFTPRYLDANYPEDWAGWNDQTLVIGMVELQSNPGNYLLYGQFNVFDNQPQPCITVVDDTGTIQEHFFQGQGATEHTWLSSQPTRSPGVHKVVELENGDLLVGGEFSDFMGTTHHNMIKLKLGVLGTENQSALNQKFKLYPNPSDSFVNLSFVGLVSGTVNIMNLTGQVVETHQMNGETLQLDTSELPKGVYFVVLETEEGRAIKKMVVN